MSVHLPELRGATAWLNSEPLDPAGLRGSVVLVNFWTLTCINWLRQEPYVRAWAQAYREDGLIVLGVHTPEFGFEHSVEEVRRAVAARGIDYPVVIDNEYAVWNAFANRYWPALYFVDREGVIRDEHFGEGRYEESERVLQTLLGVEREPVPVVGEGIEAAADWEHLGTPETYLGALRGDSGARLSGDWATEREYIRAQTGGASIAFGFQARDANLVLRADAPVGFRVTLDGEPPGVAAGGDVDAAGHGELREGRLYQLIRQPGRIEAHTLEITFAAPGAEAYVFTFG